MSLDAIPIHVINAPSAETGLTGNAPPLLREIEQQVEAVHPLLRKEMGQPA